MTSCHVSFAVSTNKLLKSWIHIFS